MVEVSYTDSTITETAVAEFYPAGTAMLGTVENLLPAEALCVAKALDISNNILKQAQETITLIPGKNQVEFDFEEPSIDEYTFRLYERHEQEEELYSWWIYLVWQQVEGVKYYKVTGDGTPNSIYGEGHFEKEYIEGEAPTDWQADYENGMRFCGFDGYSCYYNGEVGLQQCYESRDEILNVYYDDWTFEIKPME